jgi:hypothetical protein
VRRCTSPPFFAESLPDVRLGVFSPFANVFNPFTMCATASDCPTDYAMECVALGGADMSSLWDNMDIDPFGMCACYGSPPCF